MWVIPLVMIPHGLDIAGGEIHLRGRAGSDTMIGVAGMVAVNLWKAGNDPDRMDYIYNLLDDPNCMSKSDWREAGLKCGAVLTETQRSQIEAVIDLLCGPLRSELLAQARKLIIESRDSYIWGE